MSKKVFEKSWIVPASAIDEQQHVNNLTYLQWCLDGAQEHWESVASASFRRKYIWYVLSHSIQYKSQAFKGDEVTLKTWVTTAAGVKSERKYQLFKGDNLVIDAQTLWCLLEASTKRPMKIPESVKALFL